MSDTMVTLHGWVGGDVSFRTPQGISVANFRVACTPRVKRADRWQDGETTWYSVTVWRTLAEHVRDSVHRGEAVIVHGRLRTQTWQRSSEEPEITTLQVDATLVGHDLTRGTSAFLKAQRSDRGDSEVDREIAEMVAEDLAVDAPPLDSWGNSKTATGPLRSEPAA
jgi:single-strand DNA-binding protein